jgi:regulator of replication initiation timing
MEKSKQIVEKQFTEQVDWVLMQKLRHLEKIYGDIGNDLHYFREDNEKLRDENNRLKAENEDLKNELHEPYSIKGMCKKLGVCENTLNRYCEEKLLNYCTDGCKKIWFWEFQLQEFIQKTDARNMVKVKKKRTSKKE